MTADPEREGQDAYIRDLDDYDRRRGGRPVKLPRSTALGQLLTVARLARGWTLQQAADALGIRSQTEVSNWEKGTAHPGSRRLWRIQQVYELDAGELLLACHFAPKTHSGRKASS